jgi:hypothetical protein
MALRDNISYPFFIQTVFFLLVFGNSHVYSQMANFGVVIYTDTAAIVKVQGNFSNDQAGSVQHNGLLDIDNQFINTNGQVRGNGKYRVTGDWINSALFIPDTSHVFLRGAAQQITGSVSTHFYNLTLQGSGLKRQTLNSFVGNNFNLNNLEFSTDIDTIFVSNKTNSAIRYDNSFTAEGFISSMKDGCVAWKTASLQNYIFPVGNKVPSYRFRPIAVLSSKNTDKYYYVRFINHDPTMDAKPVSQKDTLTCIVNTNFYHMVNRDTDGDSCILSVYYLPADGTWTNNSQWNSQWKTLKSQNTTTSNFKTLSANIINFNQPYFALSTIAGPTPPLLSTAVCAGDSVPLAKELFFLPLKLL